MADDSPCTCEDLSQTRDKTCYACDKKTSDVLMTAPERKVHCKKHHIVYICGGGPPFLCAGCAEKGWTVEGGDGGGNRATNKRTGQYRNSEYWHELHKKTPGGNAGRSLLDYCEEHEIDVENATLQKMPKYMGSKGTGEMGEEMWCFEWAMMFDYEDYGPHDKEEPSRIFVDGHTEWCWEGVIHRDDGPAVLTAGGEEYYFKKGRRVDSEGQPLEEEVN